MQKKKKKLISTVFGAPLLYFPVTRETAVKFLINKLFTTFHQYAHLELMGQVYHGNYNELKFGAHGTSLIFCFPSFF